VLSFSIPEDIVEPWWPNGYGSQKLYNVTASFENTETGESSSMKKKVGFRQAIRSQKISTHELV